MPNSHRSCLAKGLPLWADHAANGEALQSWAAWQPLHRWPASGRQAPMRQCQPTCAPDGQAETHILPVGEFAVLGVNLFHHALQRIQEPVLHSPTQRKTMKLLGQHRSSPAPASRLSAQQLITCAKALQHEAVWHGVLPSREAMMPVHWQRLCQSRLASSPPHPLAPDALVHGVMVQAASCPSKFAMSKFCHFCWSSCLGPAKVAQNKRQPDPPAPGGLLHEDQTTSSMLHLTSIRVCSEHVVPLCWADQKQPSGPKGSQTHLHQVDPCAGQLAGSILPQAPVKAAQQLLCLYQGDPALASSHGSCC